MTPKEREEAFNIIEAFIENPFAHLLRVSPFGFPPQPALQVRPLRELCDYVNSFVNENGEKDEEIEVITSLCEIVEDITKDSITLGDTRAESYFRLIERRKNLIEELTETFNPFLEEYNKCDALLENLYSDIEEKKENLEDSNLSSASTGATYIENLDDQITRYEELRSSFDNMKLDTGEPVTRLIELLEQANELY